MPIKPKFSRNDTRRQLQGEREKIIRDLTEIMKIVGELFVSNVRSHGNWQDDSGSLRSSAGYLVILNGKVLFSVKPSGGDPREAFDRLSSELPIKKGLVLIGMVAMNYASYVEAMGYDVITTSRDKAYIDLTKNVKSYAASIGYKLI